MESLDVEAQAYRLIKSNNTALLELLIDNNLEYFERKYSYAFITNLLVSGCVSSADKLIDHLKIPANHLSSSFLPQVIYEGGEVGIMYLLDRPDIEVCTSNSIEIATLRNNVSLLLHLVRHKSFDVNQIELRDVFRAMQLIYNSGSYPTVFLELLVKGWDKRSSSYVSLQVDLMLHEIYRKLLKERLEHMELYKFCDFYKT